MPIQTNTMTNRYGSIAAEIYDIDKPLRSMADTAFHVERLSRVKGPILEPACGSGRALIPLLEAGCEMSGFDSSAEMLARCRARCAERGFAPDLTQQRFEDFQYDRPFAAIVVPVSSFTLIDSFEAALGVLGRFYDHLAAGGVLILDIQSLSSLASTTDDRRCWTADNGDLLTVTGTRLKTDWINQREEHLTRYERWRDHRLIESQLEPMALRYWGRQEMMLALRATGFADVSVFGNYDADRSPRPGDRQLTFEATKA